MKLELRCISCRQHFISWASLCVSLATLKRGAGGVEQSARAVLFCDMMKEEHEDILHCQVETVRMWVRLHL